ncbi:MAG: hypothetical protein D6719_10205 [Candidatus Dadabacteria bacterium]|nr:MAG: hypothetical protein D6719_10205 [Candidatus Dadabacteria bacterium]
MALGGILVREAAETVTCKRFLAAVHGVALIIILVAGFGMIARLQISWPWPIWLYAKIAVWLFMALSPVIIRKCSSRVIAFFLVFLAALTAAMLGVVKPT